MRRTRWLFQTLVLLIGCESPGGPLQVEQVERLDPSACAPRADGDPVERVDRGVFDLVLGDRSSYLLTPRVRNESAQALALTGAAVELEWVMDGETLPVSIRCEGGETCDRWEILPCEDVTCPTLEPTRSAVLELAILPRALSTYLLEMLDGAVAEGRAPPEFPLRAHLEVRGELADGTPVTSAVFEFPLTVCLGCLVETPADADSPSVEGPDCCAGRAPAPACHEGQDAPIDCRRCAAFYPELCNYGRVSCAP